MEEITNPSAHAARSVSFKRIIKKIIVFVARVLEKVLDASEVNLKIMRREADLFFGALFTLIGIFGFHSGKYCDGNTADYLSCTRPTTFYYYGWLEIALIIIGVFFMLLWFLKRQKN